jgi:AraC-like DNA-binding protein
MEIHYEDHKNRIKVWHRRQMGFQPHFHNSIEILYVISEKCTAMSDFKEYTVEAGDVFVNFPIQIHSYKDIEPLDSYLLIFPASVCHAFSDTLAKYVPSNPVVKAGMIEPDRIKSLVIRLNDTNAQSITAYKSGTLEGYFTALLGELLPHLHPTEENRNYSTEHKIIAYCTEKYKDDLTLDSVSRDLHISKYHISHLFSNKLKTGFCSFVNSLRLSEAIQHLQRGESITQVALSSGFPSVRTFNRIFRAEYDTSPSDYLKKLSKK